MTVTERAADDVPVFVPVPAHRVAAAGRHVLPHVDVVEAADRASHVTRDLVTS